MNPPETMAKKVCLHTAARLGLADQLKTTLDKRPGEIDARDQQGRSPLHHASLHGHEEAVELLLSMGALCLQDEAGDSPLHLASSPMVAYQVASKWAAACTLCNKAGKSPVDLAAATERGEVLNALLLACSGQGGSEALESMQQLLKRGAVCDTWAPNGSSALMLAAAIDCTVGVELLLANGATIELQDALGRTALMFAAGNDATSAVAKLLQAGASVSIRDRRGRNVLDYAVEGSSARKALTQHLQQLESKATQLQAALLAELCGEAPPKQAAKQQQQQPAAAKAKKSKKKKGKGKRATADSAAPTSLAAVQEEEEEEEGSEKAGGEQAAPGCAAASAEQQQVEEDGVGRPPNPEVGEEEAGAQEHMSDEAQRSHDVSPSPANAESQAASSAEGDNSRPPSPPGSPGWCTVSKPHRQHSKPVAVPAPLPLRQLHQQHHHHHVGRAASSHHQQQPAWGSQGKGTGRFDAGSLDSRTSQGVKRCASNGSLASTCSGESHDTDASSRLSGSERSVLRPTSRHALAALHGMGAAKMAPFGQGPLSAAGIKAAAGLGHWVPAAAEAGKLIRALPARAAWASSPAALTPSTWAKVAEGSSASTQPQPAAAAARDSSSPDADSLPLSPIAAMAAPSAAAQAGEEDSGSVCAMVAALHAQVAQLQRQQAEAEVQHRQELAAVLEDAAQHEALAVQQAVAAERMNCVVRFTTFLQHSGSALCTSFPDVFGGSASLAAVGPLQGFGSSGSPGASGCGVGGLHSLLATATNNCLGLAYSPPSAGAAFGARAFPSLTPAAEYPSTSLGGLLGSAGKAVGTQQEAMPELFGSLLDSDSPLSLSSSPLSSTPFSYQDIETRLRGEYKGNHSTFLVPAVEPTSPRTVSLLSTSLHSSLGTGV